MADAERQKVGPRVVVFFASLLLAVGLILIFLPLIAFWQYLLPDEGVDEGRFVQVLMLSPVLVMAGTLCSFLSVIVLFDRIIGIKAIAAGNLKWANAELPVRIEGFVLAFVALIVGVALFWPKLEWDDYRENQIAFQELLSDHAEEIAALEGRVRELGSELERQGDGLSSARSERDRYYGQSTAYRTILTGANTSAEDWEVMRLQVECSPGDEYWVNWGRETERGWQSSMFRGDGADFPGLRYHPNSPRFFLELDHVRFLVITLDFDAHGLFARIQPTGDHSLSDLCEMTRSREREEALLSDEADQQRLGLSETASREADQ